MKTLNKLALPLTLLVVAVVVSSARAEFSLPRIITGSPSIIIKAGGDPETKGAWVVIAEAELTRCNSYAFCYNPLIVAIDNNVGFGGDVIYKPFKTSYKNAMKLALGIVELQDPLSGDDPTNIHAGLNFEARIINKWGIVLSADHFTPLDSSVNDHSTTIYSAGIKYSF